MDPTGDCLRALGEMVRGETSQGFVTVKHDGTPAPYTAVAGEPQSLTYALTVVTDEEFDRPSVHLSPVGHRGFGVFGLASQGSDDDGWTNSPPIYAEAQDLAWELQKHLDGATSV